MASYRYTLLEGAGGAGSRSGGGATRPNLPIFPQEAKTTSSSNSSTTGTCGSLLDKKQEFNILEKLKLLRDQRQFCDVILEVRGIKLEAHKNVLASWSPYFANKLLNDDPKVCKDYILVNYDNGEVFADLLDFMYNGYVAPRETNFLQLLHLAVSFKIEMLKNYCEEFLRCNLHLGNFVSTYFLSRKYQLDSLEEYIVGFLQLNLSDAVKQGEFLSLKATKFNTLLSKGSMEKIKPEIKLFLIISWVGYDVNEREKFLVLLLGHIDWSAVANDFLLEINRTENFFTSHESSLYLLLQTLFSAGIGLGPYTDMFPALRESHSTILNDVVHSSLLQIETEDFHQVTIVVRARPSFRSVPSITIKSGPHCDMVDTSMNTDVNSRHFEESEIVHLEPEKQAIDDQAGEEEAKDDGNDNIDEFGRFLESEIHEINLKEQEKLRDLEQSETILDLQEPEPQVAKRVTRSTRKSPRNRKVKSVHEIEEEQVKLEQVFSGNAAVVDGDGMRVVDEQQGDTEDSGSEYKPTVADKASDDEEMHEMETHKTRDAILSVIKKKKGKKTKTKSSGTRAGKSRICEFKDCAYITKYEKRMEKHVKTAHESSFELRCNLCTFDTKEVRKFNAHMKTHFPGPPYKCDYLRCTWSADKIGPLMTHRSQHTDERPYTCECGMSFRTNNTLIAHRKIHLGKKEFLCPECNVGFATKNTLSQHMVTHSDARPYLCDLCGFSTKFQSHLIAHKRLHTGEVFSCQFPKCTYFTPKRSQLKSHMRAHLGIRSHVCETCGKAFVERSHLIRHEKLHRDAKIKCDLCDYTTTRNDKLKEHIIKHHGDGSPPKQKKAKLINTGTTKAKKPAPANRKKLSSSYAEVSTPMLVKWDHGGYSLSQQEQTDAAQQPPSEPIMQTDSYCVLRNQITSAEPIQSLLTMDQINAQINASKVLENDVNAADHDTTTLTAATECTGIATGVIQNAADVNVSNLSGLGLVSSPGHMGDQVVNGTIVTSCMDGDQSSQQTYTLIQPAVVSSAAQGQDYGGLSAIMALF